MTTRREGQSSMVEPTKKAWNVPELIVIVRSRPEEGILSACKGSSYFGADIREAGCDWGGSCELLSPS